MRDVLARRIPRNAREPYAVATAQVKRRGTAYWERRLPKAEVERELAEQKAMRHNPGPPKQVELTYFPVFVQIVADLEKIQAKVREQRRKA